MVLLVQKRLALKSSQARGKTMARSSSIPFDDIAKAIAAAVTGGGGKAAAKAVKGKAKKATPKKGAGGGRAVKGGGEKPPKGPGKPPTGGAKPAPRPKPKKPAGGASKAPATKDNKLIKPVPKKKVAQPKKRMTKEQREVARREKFESMPRAGKIAKVPPRREPRGNISGRRTFAKSEADKREAQRQANRLLRMSGGKPAPRARQGVEKPVEVKGSVVKATKRSKSQPMGPSSSYEADIMRRIAAMDRRRIR